MAKKSKPILGITLLVIAAIIIAGVFAVYELVENDDDKEDLIEEIIVIDDQISPLTNQGLVLEIQRIRHRGLLDKMMKIGNSWKQKPSFYFISNIDGVEYVSKDVHAASGSNEQLFNTWDTIMQENKILSDADEEQEKAVITLTIVERVSSGLFGLRSSDIEQEQIKIAYDYKTGRWTGDDYFMDADGYGHHLGETFEVWFKIYPVDYDHDGIPYWTEVNILNTNPKDDDDTLDDDGDGCSNAWEWRWGYDPHVWDDHRHLDPDLDGIENVEEERIERWFANPFSQDIYIETDGMKKGGFNDPAHYCWIESQQIMIERFAQHGYKVYIDDGWADGPVNGGGELLPHYDVISQDSGMMAQFYQRHFAEERKGTFRYFVVGHKTGFCHPSAYNSYDTLSIGTAKDVMNGITRHAFTPRLKRLNLASLMMHEGGHSLGISPWTIEGCDNASYAGGKAAKTEFLSKWGNYESVMNYYYVYDYSVVDYSAGDDSDGDQNDWENLYLPSFQTESTVIEAPDFQVPGTAAIVLSVNHPEINGWKYDENLTMRDLAELNDLYVLENVPADVRVYVKEDRDNKDEENTKDVKVYVKPLLENTYSEYLLVAEGTLDTTGEENTIEYYSQNQLIEQVNEHVAQIENDENE